MSAVGTGAAGATDMRVLFGEVIGIKELRSVQGIINLLHEGQQISNSARRIHRFTDEAYKLPAISITPAQVRAGRTTVALKPTKDSGTFGTCFKTAVGNEVYKQIKIEPAKAIADGKITADEVDDFIEAKVRGVYVEAFIQTVLSSDPDVGGFITRPLHLYKSTSMRRAPIAGAAGAEIELYIHMGVNQYKFEEWINELMRLKGSLLEASDIVPLWSQIGSTLDVLRRKYGFYHGDLHGGNVMVDSTGNLKIIDFGMSCLTYEGQLYRSVDFYETVSKVCRDNDLLIHVMSFLEYESKRTFLPTERQRIKGLLDYSTDNFYNVCADVASVKGTATFWQAYDWGMEPGLHALYETLRRRELRHMDIPRRFVIAIQGMAGAPTGGVAAGVAGAAAGAPFSGSSNESSGCVIMGGRRRRTFRGRRTVKRRRFTGRRRH